MNMFTLGLANGYTDSINEGMRHIATVTNETDSAVSQFEITKDKDGNPFSCSEFFVFATFPPIENGCQLYIGSKMYDWMFFCGSARSATATHTAIIELRHTGGGWWNGSMLSKGDVSSLVSAVSGPIYTNFRSHVNIGEKADGIVFSGGNVGFPSGTFIEVYGR